MLAIDGITVETTIRYCCVINIKVILISKNNRTEGASHHTNI